MRSKLRQSAAARASGRPASICVPWFFKSALTRRRSAYVAGRPGTTRSARHCCSLTRC